MLIPWKENLHGRQGDQRAEGSRGDSADVIVIERKQPHWAQSSKGVIVDTADRVAPQHPAGMKTRN